MTDAVSIQKPIKSTLTWYENEQRKKYWHEAGHAVIARLNGFHVSWVSTDLEFIKNDPLAIEHECNQSEAVCMTISTPRIRPVLANRKPLNKAEKETVIGYCMHVLAGPRVEQWFDPESFNPFASQNDAAQVSNMLALVEPNAAKNKSMLQIARRRMDKMIAEEWDKIGQVAYALYQKGTVHAAELDHLIAGVGTYKAA